MANPKECRKFRADLREGRNLSEVKIHVTHCSDCQNAIETALQKNSGTLYEGENVSEVLNNVKPVSPRKSFTW
ncbi:MAG: hypothetical protein NTY75_04025 [Candidatus Shapirobacteria bacterium]|nr:hypothetical protein [Candidatus Shapirobacteria bacterium]